MYCPLREIPRAVVAAAVAALALALPTVLAQTPLPDALLAQAQANQAAAASQRTVDQLAEETSRMLEEYRGILRRVESLDAYNNQIERIVNSQNEEITAINDQLGRLETTNREVVPLMIQMIGALESFVRLDVPFLPDERAERVKGLREVMDRADVTTSEKYRRILEAYQVEMEYGRTIEAYRGSQPIQGGSREVDFLRFGRIGLYYQTLDGGEVGYWNQAERKWQVLDDSYRYGIRQGLQIARKQIAPDLVKLPIPAPVAATAP